MTSSLTPSWCVLDTWPDLLAGLDPFGHRCNAWRLKPSEEPQISRFCTTFSMELLWDIESTRVRPELLVKGSGPGA